MSAKAKWICVAIAALWIGIACLHCSCQAAIADDARKIIEAIKGAVVTLELVVEISFPENNTKEESKVSATGTIIDPSGLIVSSLSELDPIREFADFMFVDAGSRKPQTNVTNAKIRTEDGTEIPVDVVLRDQDLDLIFLRPKQPLQKPLPYIDIKEDSAPQIMDELLMVWRLGQVANRALAADVVRVQSVITKPRLAYAVNVDSLGCPVFTLEGKPVGITVFRRLKTTSREEMFAFSSNWLTIVLPCSTVQKAAEQAKQAKPEKPAKNVAPAPASKPESQPPAKTK
ncbi:MAG: hypothetical protein ACUVT8_11125 [Armatimonadota bacterium]